MTETGMPLTELLQKHDAGNFSNVVTEVVVQTLMEHDVGGIIGDVRYERGAGRQTDLDGCRNCKPKTRMGAMNLRVPKLWTGSYFPGFLEPGGTPEKALVAAQEARIGGISTRKTTPFAAVTV